MKKMPIHIIADVHWISPHIPKYFETFSPGNFRIPSFFTSDFSIGWTVEVNPSKVSLADQADWYPVRLFFYALDEKRDEIKRLSKNANLLIMAGYEVIAVCRNLRIPEMEIYMDTPWTN